MGSVDGEWRHNRLPSVDLGLSGVEAKSGEKMVVLNRRPWS